MKKKVGYSEYIDKKTDCFYLEASTPQLKDVVRIEDDYKRL